MFQTVAWATSFSGATSRRGIRVSFSNSSRTSLRTLELIRGGGRLFPPYLHDSLGWYAWYHSRIVGFTGGIFSYLSMNSLCTAIFPYPSVIHNMHWARSVPVYPFRDISAFCMLSKSIKRRKPISLPYTFFLTCYTSVWKVVAELIQYSQSCSRLSYFELYSEDGFSDDRTKTLVKNKKLPMYLT